LLHLVGLLYIMDVSSLSIWQKVSILLPQHGF